MESNKSVFGVYLGRMEAESAISTLKEAGFSTSDISLLLPQSSESEQLVTDDCTKAPGGAVAGAGSGATLGGVLGWLLGVGALVIPGIGPVIAAGPIVSCLAGVGIGGALGGFAGSLIGIGISEDEARKYEGRLQKGGILLAAHCETPDDIKRAGEIMRNCGGQDVAPSGELEVERRTAS